MELRNPDESPSTWLCHVLHVHDLLKWRLQDEENHIKGPKKKKKKKKKNWGRLTSSNLKGYWPTLGAPAQEKHYWYSVGSAGGTKAGLSRPLSLMAWHGRDVTESTKQMDGGIRRERGDSKEVEENKRIVLRVEKGPLWRRQIAYEGEMGWGGGHQKDRKVKPAFFCLLIAALVFSLQTEVIHNATSLKE